MLLVSKSPRSMTAQVSICIKKTENLKVYPNFTTACTISMVQYNSLVIYVHGFVYMEPEKIGKVKRVSVICELPDHHRMELSTSSVLKRGCISWALWCVFQI